MEYGLEIFQAALNCSYKAWQLIKRENVSEPISTNQSITTKKVPVSKIALAAWDYSISQNLGQAIKSSEKAKRLYESLKEIASQDVPPNFYKNVHCSECQFWDSCYPKLRDRDCISLLGGMTPKVLSKYHSKGILTILQLSYLFRLRRKRRNLKVTGRFLWELKALAIREKKTFILQSPPIETYPSVYIDFEGLPEENMIYLIGVIVKMQENHEKVFSFWANSKGEEETVFTALFDLLDQYSNAHIYHYGSYEIKQIKRIKKLIHKEGRSDIEKRMINLLGYFRTHVYPPTYTNSLKEIAGTIGFQWQDTGSDGLTSVEWRRRWETEADDKWKFKLIQYNQDDCNALMKVHEWLKQLATNNEQENVQEVSQMRKYSPYKLQSNSEFGKDFDYINKAAYFDYQRNKIYWREEKKFSPVSNNAKKSQPKRSGRGRPAWQPKKINEIRQVPKLKACPGCKHRKLYHLNKQSTFIQTDLKFTKSGIKQWVVEYRSGMIKCAKCGRKYNDGVLQQLRYGDNIFAWSINLYVNYHVSYAMISRLLHEQFGIWANPVYFNDRNYMWWQRFKPEVDYCWQIIRNSPVIHIDETTVRLSRGKDKGYVWVFATPHTVFYHLTLKHEADFLHEWLKNYKGVIVTDFFPVYESLSVKKQKCLIHLIRDLNDELFKNPFDEDYKEFVNAFSQLLKGIVATIDNHGLKTLYLRKHSKDTALFYKTYIDSEYESELLKKYAKRIKKHWGELWTFLSYDNVPWNNNNAEVAIKAFAQHRRGVNGQVSEKGLSDYLSMLTIAQTCRYRNISFLEFIRGKAGIWQNIHPDLLPGFLPFNQAKLFVHTLKLSSGVQWEQSKKKRSTFIPADPDVYYKEKGWIDWKDWLGV